MKIFFSVGEPSGDLHGANLIRSLRNRHSNIICCGYGGPRMAAAGCHLQTDLTQLAVMGLFHAIRNLHHFWRLYRQALQVFRDDRPDAVVLIDYPGFNWWMARAAKRHQIPVFYYGVPQMWAWAGWRVRKMRRLVDHVLCKLPFETEWFAERGCQATYVGHPYFDEVSQRQLDQTWLEKQHGPLPLVTILPGSRTQEVRANLPAFLRAAQQISHQFPEVRFAIAAFSERHAELARQLLQSSSLAIEVHVGRTPELIEAATCCMACSGSVSLELLYHEKPTVISYVTSRLMEWLARRLVQVRYITLVNLLISANRFAPSDPRDSEPEGEAIFPEIATHQDPAAWISNHVVRWLRHPAERAARIARLQQLKREIAHPGASARAADYILQALGTLPSSPPNAAPTRRVA